MRNATIICVALLVDTFFGEPPAAVHPVVWMGRLLDALESAAPQRAPARFVYGSCIAVLLPLVWAGLARFIERRLPWQLHGFMLKPAFAGRALLESARQVEVALRADDLTSARDTLHALVSRPTEDLDRPLIVAAAIESLAENATDSWLAPLLAYGAFGLSGAYAYRAINTADAMWGYHTPRFEHLGKAAARLDDLVNFVPARLGALSIVCAAGEAWRQALGSWRTDGARTSSPNAGQTMASAAGALAVRLEKQGQYVLNAGAVVPDVNDLARGRRLIRGALWIGAAVCIVLTFLRSGPRE